MKPYNRKDQDLEKRIFDYRLSRARRIVENAFGILANRFRLSMTPIALAPDKVEIITLQSAYITCYVYTRVLSTHLLDQWIMRILIPTELFQVNGVVKQVSTSHL